MKMKKRAHPGFPSAHRGFSMVEVIAVLVVLGVLSAVILSRYMSTSEADAGAQASVVKNSIRYAQSRAMKMGNPEDPQTVWGIRSQGNQYWLFRGTAPDDNATWVPLPAEGADIINLANYRVTMTAFTVVFDSNGRPYTSYTTAASNIPVSADNQVIATVAAAGGGASTTFNVTPETGFIR